jgi:hypothetical protein
MDTEQTFLGNTTFLTRRVYEVRATGEVGLDVARAGVVVYLSFWSGTCWTPARAFAKDTVRCVGTPSALWGW